MKQGKLKKFNKLFKLNNLNKLIKNKQFLLGVILFLALVIIYLNMEDIEDFIVGKIFKTNIQHEGNLYSKNLIIGKKKIMAEKACFDGDKKCLDYWDFFNFKALPLQDDKDYTLVNTAINEKETIYLRELFSKGFRFIKNYLENQRTRYVNAANSAIVYANSILGLTKISRERFVDYEPISDKIPDSETSTFYGDVVIKGKVNANIKDTQFVKSNKKIITKEFCLKEFDNCLNKTDVRTYKKYSDRILYQLCIGNYCLEEKHFKFLLQLFSLNIINYYNDLSNKYKKILDLIEARLRDEQYKRRGAPNKKPFGHCKVEQCTVPWRGRRCKGYHEDFSSISKGLTYYKGDIKTNGKLILQDDSETKLIKTKKKVCLDNDEDEVACLSADDVPVFDNFARKTPDRKKMCLKGTCVEEKHFYYLKQIYQLQIFQAFERLAAENNKLLSQVKTKIRNTLNWQSKYCRREQCRSGRICKGG